jgi:crossover junction endodeoxyribonuclease RuvC
MVSKRIILGVDPGTSVLGYALLQQEGGNLSVLAAGVVELAHIPDHYLKLDKIHRRIVSIIDEFLPSELAIESPFFGKNVQSALKLGRAQGVAIAAAISRSLPVAEYAPTKVKMSITGNGAASKEQVAQMLSKLLKIEKGLPHDATDALGVALCHHYQTHRAVQGPIGTKFSSWKDFIASNPGRAKL